MKFYRQSQYGNQTQGLVIQTGARPGTHLWHLFTNFCYQPGIWGGPFWPFKVGKKSFYEVWSNKSFLLNISDHENILFYKYFSQKVIQLQRKEGRVSHLVRTEIPQLFSLCPCNCVPKGFTTWEPKTSRGGDACSGWFPLPLPHPTFPFLPSSLTPYQSGLAPRSQNVGGLAPPQPQDAVFLTASGNLQPVGPGLDPRPTTHYLIEFGHLT